ncbi:hypothetical protein [Shinella sp.]|uniref:hypothetical protein n=1 Tax=Shinella sp. TaxID=1870904 RepID=UPI003F715C3F
MITRPPGAFRLFVLFSGSTRAALLKYLRSSAIAVICALSLAGCQPTAEYQVAVSRDLDARLATFRGSTMAEFSARTGLLPLDAYPITGGRVFVIEGQPIFVTLPATSVTPAVTRGAACRLLVSTEQTSTTRTADDWKITGIQHSGPCNNLTVRD